MRTLEDRDFDRPSRWEARRDDEDLPVRTDDNACPECDEGVVISGSMCGLTGHVPAGCSAGCGWSV